MTQQYGGSTPPKTQRSTPDVARDEAADVARTAADRGSEVAGTVGDQASRVTSETQRQARHLLHEGKDQLSGQAREGQQRAAQGLHKMADQLNQMSEQAEGQGVVPEMARQAADKTRGLASWLENRDPGAVLDEVRRFARRRPAAFLVGAALAGVAVGRLTRGAVAAQQSDGDGGGRQTGANGGRYSGSGPGPMAQRVAPSAPPAATYPPQQAYPPPATGVPPAPPQMPPQMPPPPATTPDPGWVNR